MSDGQGFWGEIPSAESTRFGAAQFGAGPWGAQHVQQAQARPARPTRRTVGGNFVEPGDDDLASEAKPIAKGRGFSVLEGPGGVKVFRLFGDLANVKS